MTRKLMPRCLLCGARIQIVEGQQKCRCNTITHAKLRAAAKALGVMLRITNLGYKSNEFRLCLKKVDGGTEANSYYTNDSEDALKTMMHMARERDKRKLPQPAEEQIVAYPGDDVDRVQG